MIHFWKKKSSITEVTPFGQNPSIKGEHNLVNIKQRKADKIMNALSTKVWGKKQMNPSSEQLML